MESLDKEIAEVFAEHPPAVQGPARILIVSTDNELRACLRDKLLEDGHRCACADSLIQARSAIARRRFDLLLLNLDLADGDVPELVRALRSVSPPTRSIVFAGAASFAKVVGALRCGAVDFMRLPADVDQLCDRVKSALVEVRADMQREERLVRLKSICKKLAAARHEVSQQVERLCKDLVEAYQDVSLQMTEVAMASEFRTLLKQELDVEALLRTALEYLLTKTDPTNAAVFLPDSAGRFDLGAYVNYDCPRETVTTLLDHLCQYVCPQMAEESEIVAFSDASEFAAWVGAEVGFLAGCQVIAFSCLHEGECLAVMVLFRSKSAPFAEELAGAIDILRPIFAEQISNVIKVHHRATPSWPDDPAAGDEYDYNDYDDLGFGGYAA